MPTINLPKFIAEHYKGGITARDVVREALTNALHAGATNVTVDLSFAQKQQSFLDDERNYLRSITVIDNGEGFTDANLRHFDEICTSHKDDIGGKGVGRLAYLKFAEKVEVRSQLTNQLVAFSYTPSFSLDNVSKFPSIGHARTSVKISEPKEEVYTQVTKLINAVCDDLRLLMFLKRKRGEQTSIKFTHNSTQPFPHEFVFSSAEIEPLLEQPLSIDSTDFSTYLFRDDGAVVSQSCFAQTKSALRKR